MRNAMPILKGVGVRIMRTFWQLTTVGIFLGIFAASIIYAHNEHNEQLCESKVLMLMLLS